MLDPALVPVLSNNKYIDVNKLPLSLVNFMGLFNIDVYGNVTAKNNTKIKRAFENIISYYPGNIDEMPKIIEENPIRIEMTSDQEQNYWNQSVKETKLKNLKLSKKGNSQQEINKINFLKRLKIVANKHMFTRSASNFFYGNVNVENALENNGGDYISQLLEEYKEETEEVKEEVKQEPENEQKDDENEDIEGLSKNKQNLIPDKLKHDGGWIERDLFATGELYKKYSTKISALMVVLTMFNNHKHFLFTTFKTRSGVMLIQGLLSMCGINAGIYSGDLDDSQRKSILATFNSRTNIYGKHMKILLATEAGCEGISVKCVRHMHILESSPRVNKVIQAIGRVARYGSHSDLPKEERNVRIWRYFSVGSSNDSIVNIKERDQNGNLVLKQKIIPGKDKKTIDIELYEKGQNQYNQIQSFLKLLENIPNLTNKNN
jgi:hypothetical protein